MVQYCEYATKRPNIGLIWRLIYFHFEVQFCAFSSQFFTSGFILKYCFLIWNSGLLIFVWLGSPYSKLLFYYKYKLSSLATIFPHVSKYPKIPVVLLWYYLTNNDNIIFKNPHFFAFGAITLTQVKQIDIDFIMYFIQYIYLFFCFKMSVFRKRL